MTGKEDIRSGRARSALSAVTVAVCATLAVSGVVLGHGDDPPVRRALVVATASPDRSQRLGLPTSAVADPAGEPSLVRVSGSTWPRETATASETAEPQPPAGADLAPDLVPVDPATAAAIAALREDAHHARAERRPADDAVRALDIALGTVGAPYVWGGSGPTTFDCSGLIWWSYRETGVSLPRVAANQYATGGHRVAIEDLRPGDLVFFATAAWDPGVVHHVGMYAGHGLMVAAPRPGLTVRVEPVPAIGYVGAVRPVPAPTPDPTSPTGSTGPTPTSPANSPGARPDRVPSSGQLPRGRPSRPLPPVWSDPPPVTPTLSPPGTIAASPEPTPDPTTDPTTDPTMSSPGETAPSPMTTSADPTPTAADATGTAIATPTDSASPTVSGRQVWAQMSSMRAGPEWGRLLLSVISG